MIPKKPAASSESFIEGKYKVLIAILISTFVAGFVVGEDGMGGGIRIDLYQFHGPTMFALREMPWSHVISDYTSATTPLFHILESFNPLLGHDTAFRAFNVVLALVMVYSFVLALRRRFPLEPGLQPSAALIGSSMLLSTYFRAEAYWVTTDILPLLFVVCAAILLLPTQDTVSTLKPLSGPVILIIATLSWSAFYCRQTYLFMPIYSFALFFHAYPKIRWQSVTTFLALAIPGGYLVWLWKGINPPRFQHHEKLSRDGIVAPFSMILIYSLPFIAEAMIANHQQLSKYILRKIRLWPWLLASWLLFLAFFHNYRFDAMNRGGGIASRVLSPFAVPGAFIFLTLSFLGLLVVVWLIHRSTWRFRLLIVTFLLPAMAMKLFFQRYYDPVLIVLFFLFADRTLIRPFLKPRLAFLLMAFNALLLIGAFAYNGRDKRVFLPLNSTIHPWDGTALAGRVH